MVVKAIRLASPTLLSGDLPRRREISLMPEPAEVVQLIEEVAADG